MTCTLDGMQRCPVGDLLWETFTDTLLQGDTGENEDAYRRYRRHLVTCGRDE